MPTKTPIEAPVTVGDLARLEREAQAARAVADAATDERNAAIVRAVGQGLRNSEVAAATGISAVRVGQIVRRGAS